MHSPTRVKAGTPHVLRAVRAVPPRLTEIGHRPAAGRTSADGTGTGDRGRADDIAIVWPPHTGPLVVAVRSDRTGYGTPPVESLIGQATAQIAAALT